MRHLEKSISNVSQEEEEQQQNKRTTRTTTTFKLIERDARVENMMKAELENAGISHSLIESPSPS